MTDITKAPLDELLDDLSRIESRPPDAIWAGPIRVEITRRFAQAGAVAGWAKTWKQAAKCYWKSHKVAEAQTEKWVAELDECGVLLDMEMDGPVIRHIGWRNVRAEAAERERDELRAALERVDSVPYGDGRKICPWCQSTITGPYATGHGKNCQRQAALKGGDA